MKISIIRILFSISLGILLPFATLLSSTTIAAILRAPFCRQVESSFLELSFECRWYSYPQSYLMLIFFMTLLSMIYWLSGFIEKRLKQHFSMITTLLLVILIMFIADIQYHRKWQSTCRAFKKEPNKILSDTYLRCHSIWNPFSWSTNIYDIYDSKTGRLK